jgi:hypothetical protein
MLELVAAVSICRPQCCNSYAQGPDLGFCGFSWDKVKIQQVNESPLADLGLFTFGKGHVL